MKEKVCREESMNPNDYSGSDSERIARAARVAFAAGEPLRITARRPDAVSDRQFWLIDSAILLPENATLILENCKIRLSDRCRDNFIRSANCGLGIENVPPLRNIHILGVGHAVLEGAERPRATGDSGKMLGERTFGTDARRIEEIPVGDWRNIGILLANVHGFSIRNVTIRESHMWAVSLEYCTEGELRSLAFHSSGTRLIDGVRQTVLNQDGLDLRRGCRNITIDTVSGATGDDLIALTAIGGEPRPCGLPGMSEVCSPQMAGMDETVSGIIIRNVVGYSAGGHQIVRFLNTGGIGMHAILLDGLLDTSPEEVRDIAAVRIGVSNPAWGGVTPLGDTAAFQIRNVTSRARNAVLIAGSLADSMICGVIDRNGENEPVVYASGLENTQNLAIFQCRSVGTH